MATIVPRDETVRLLTAQYATMAELGDRLDEEAWAAPTNLPGWSVQDVFSHVTGTESMLLGDPAPVIDVSHLTHVRNAIAGANEVWVESMRSLSGREVLDRFRHVTAQRVAILEGMTQADFDAPSWTPAGPDESYGRFMRIRHYDCYLHEHDVRVAVGANDRPDPDHVRLALTEPESALGYIVGRQAAMPEGASVRIRLTGPVAVTYDVEVTDRARVTAALPGEPTTGIVLDALLFLRLTGGRVDPEESLTDVALEGDEALARQLATRMAFTV